MEYTISLSEIARRKKAYAMLSCSILVGLAAASTICRLPVSLYGYTLIVAILLLLGVFSFRFFHRTIQSKIMLDDHSLKRIVHGVIELFAIDDIDRVTIKRTSKKTIREISVRMRHGGAVVISALDRFEEFGNELLAVIRKDVEQKETREPLDFDHPAFYAVFGLFVSGLGVSMIKMLLSLQYRQIQIGESVLFAYVIALGAYFIYAKPLSQRYGVNEKKSDTVTGLMMICSAAAVFFFVR